MKKRAMLAAAAAVALAACGGADRTAGTIEGPARSDAAVTAAQERQDAAVRSLEAAAGVRPLPSRRILFGDLHVHTTFSIDAFFFSLPIVAGEGAHPPSDACDFARHCAQLDFFSLNDHAEALTPAHWALEKESIRQCNARAGDPGDPDLVAFAGWEWTQVGTTPADHFGHKNVLFPGTADDELPARPISALPDPGDDDNIFAGLEDVLTGASLLDPLQWREYADFDWLVERLAEIPRCERGVDTRSLPPDCHENAATPDVLFEKLDQWGFPSLVIPHGTTWGLYTPAGTTMDKQLTRAYHDPERQALIEIMSGHGNSEEYRSFVEFEVDEAGERVCPEPTPDYLPCCWQAGEIMRSRCGDLPAAECEARVAEARRVAVNAPVTARAVFADSDIEEWLDCDQCRDCFKPSLGYRPRESVQYSMALSNLEERGPDGEPLRFRYGFLASSDVHTARPGTGYKQYERRRMTEATGARSELVGGFQERRLRGSQEDPQRAQPPPTGRGLANADAERVASYLYPGGLTAVHADDRSREAIWDALLRREVYGTSGPRILLWFDLRNGPGGPLPMGGETALATAPEFEVRAVGSFVQKPGCPADSVTALSPERLELLCRGECYHPSDERHPIAAIEVIRIRPQVAAGEPVGELIEDPWRRFDCDPDPAGCTVRFSDPDFASVGRDALYYARALQQETPAVNGANLRTRFDRAGEAVSVDPCYGDYRTPFDDDCLAPVQERAWSSPIFVDWSGDSRI